MRTAVSTSPGCSPPSRRSSGSTRSTGWRGSTTRRRGPQLLLQAFLQRVVNSGGRIEREYGLGRGRTDLLILWPQGGWTRKFVVECKVLHKGLDATIREGVEQTLGYLDRSAAEAGHLVIFDRREDRRWDDKVFRPRNPQTTAPSPSGGCSTPPRSRTCGSSPPRPIARVGRPPAPSGYFFGANWNRDGGRIIPMCVGVCIDDRPMPPPRIAFPHARPPRCPSISFCQSRLPASHDTVKRIIRTPDCTIPGISAVQVPFLFVNVHFTGSEQPGAVRPMF